MAIHLTPTELAREAGLERRDVISKCLEMGVPIFQGRIDKTLFLSSLKQYNPATPRRRRASRPDRSQHPERAGALSTRANPARHRTLRPRIGNLRISGTRRTPDGRQRSATSGTEASTGSRTIADLLPLAAERYGDRVAVKVQARRRLAGRHLRRGRRRSRRRSRSA